MAARASEVNKGTRKKRAEAAQGQTAHVPIDENLARSQARLDEASEIADTVIAKQKQRQVILDNIAEIRMGAKALTKEIAAEYDKVENLGFDRDCFKDMIKLKTAEAEKRIKYEASRKQLVRGFGFESGEQLDAFIQAVEKEIAAEPTGELQEGQADAIAAHIAKHGTTEQKH